MREARKNWLLLLFKSYSQNKFESFFVVLGFITLISHYRNKNKNTKHQSFIFFMFPLIKQGSMVHYHAFHISYTSSGKFGGQSLENKIVGLL